MKQRYFREHSKDGKVKCQDTSEYITFDDAHVDHRQPNTFSIIVDRFIELHRINLKEITYDKSEKYGHVFTDENLAKEFKDYHASKAKLRIVKKSRNLSRSFQARINTQKKDLIINH